MAGQYRGREGTTPGAGQAAGGAGRCAVSAGKWGYRWGCRHPAALRAGPSPWVS